MAVDASGSHTVPVALRRPRLVLEDFFDGRARGWGFMHSRWGRLVKQFDIAAHGQWDAAAQTLSLTEEYTFDDGHRDVLDWRITRFDDGRYRGTERHVDGQAEGTQEEEHFRWRYLRDVPDAGGGATRLRFDDCFHLMETGLLVARASVTRFGLEVGVMTVLYRKEAAGPEA